LRNSVEIRFGGYQGPASVHTRAVHIFGEELNRRLGNNVVFKFQENIIDQGCKAGDLLDMVETGALTMCYFSTSYLAERVPEFALLDLPFTYTDRQATYGVLDGQLGRHLANQLSSSTGYKLLHFWDNGFRHFSNSKQPISSPADCVGITIRTLFSDLHAQVFKALGFVPVALDVKDLLDGMKSQKIIAQENPLTNTYNFEIHKFHRYITLSSHFFGAAGLLCNQSAYRSWDEEMRVQVEQAAAVATAAQRQMAAAEDEKILKKLTDFGVEFLTPDADQFKLFRDAVEPVIQHQKSIFGDKMFGMLH
jgi:tripartite ATP-independent transporter DctP family solute receptor